MTLMNDTEGVWFSELSRLYPTQGTTPRRGFLGAWEIAFFQRPACFRQCPLARRALVGMARGRVSVGGRVAVKAVMLL